MSMKVYELLEQSGVTARNPLPADVEQLEITGISESSLQVANGHLFVAISGYATDGESYIGNALEALLTTLNAQYPNHEIIHIFGFRGQRDTKKFPQMVSASQTGADLTILTTDDLNGLPRQVMAEKCLEYVTLYGLDSMAMVLDRVEAVELALEWSPNPVLLVLTGKGHEAYSEVNKYGVQSDQQVAHMFRYRQVSYSM